MLKGLEAIQGESFLTVPSRVPYSYACSQRLMWCLMLPTCLPACPAGLLHVLPVHLRAGGAPPAAVFWHEPCFSVFLAEFIPYFLDLSSMRER